MIVRMDSRILTAAAAADGNTRSKSRSWHRLENGNVLIGHEFAEGWRLVPCASDPLFLPVLLTKVSIGVINCDLNLAWL